jgi:hypothetical protein
MLTLKGRRVLQVSLLNMSKFLVYFWQWRHCAVFPRLDIALAFFINYEVDGDFGIVEAVAYLHDLRLSVCR